MQLDGENTLVYWKAIAAGRKAPINSGKVRVQLPEALSGQVLSFTNFGTAAVPRQVNPKTFEFVASQLIPPEQELEVQIAFRQQILNIPQPSWQQTGNQSQSSSGEEGFFIDPGAIFFLMLFGLFPALGIITSIANRRCPECTKFKLKRTYKVLIPATTSCSEKQQVTHHCGSCSYHNEYEAVIPVISNDSGGGGGGGGGRGG